MPQGQGGGVGGSGGGGRGPPTAPTTGGTSPPAGAPAFAVFQNFSNPSFKTLEYEVSFLGKNNAMLAFDNNWTPGTAPSPGSPSQLVAALQRKTIQTANPSDTTIAYIGTDVTVSPATGLALSPGNRITISGYSGAVWSVSSSTSSPIYYKVT